jgi:hypothetical protein
VAASAAAYRSSKRDLGVTAEAVTCRRVEWEINSFMPYKSPGMDGIFPALLQQGRRFVIPHLVKIFRACVAMGFVPVIGARLR